MQLLDDPLFQSLTDLAPELVKDDTSGVTPTAT